MKVLITRPRAQANDFAAKLLKAGFEPIFFPVIEIQEVENNTELENAITNIQKYAWVVFTSVNAVGARLALALSELQQPQSGQPRVLSLRVAAVGPKTAEALRKHGIEPDFIPDEYVGEAIMSGLGDVKNKWILLPRAELAREELPKAIVKAGGVVHEIIVYRTLPAEADLAGLNALKAGVDFVTFTSPSTVENFAEVARKNHLDPFNLPNNPMFTCIGSVTENAAKATGFENIITAKEFTTDGLVEAIKNCTQVKL